MVAAAPAVSQSSSASVPLRLPLIFLFSGSAAIFVLPSALTDPQQMRVLALMHTATLGWFTICPRRAWRFGYLTVESWSKLPRWLWRTLWE